MYNVTYEGTLVAQINRQHPAADGYDRERPWLLLHLNGQVEKFTNFLEAVRRVGHFWCGAKVYKGLP